MLSKTNYLFCTKEGHESNQLNMVCLNKDCDKQGLICCMCLEEHDHMNYCMAFQRLVTYIQQKLEENSQALEIEENNCDLSDYIDKINGNYSDIRNMIKEIGGQFNSFLNTLDEYFQKMNQEDKATLINSRQNNSEKYSKFFNDCDFSNNLDNSGQFQRKDQHEKITQINTFLSKIQVSEDRKSVHFKNDNFKENLYNKILGQIDTNKQNIELSLQKLMQEFTVNLMPQKLSNEINSQDVNQFTNTPPKALLNKLKDDYFSFSDSIRNNSCQKTSTNEKLGLSKDMDYFVNQDSFRKSSSKKNSVNKSQSQRTSHFLSQEDDIEPDSRKKQLFTTDDELIYDVKKKIKDVNKFKKKIRKEHKIKYIKQENCENTFPIDLFSRSMRTTDYTDDL